MLTYGRDYEERDWRQDADAREIAQDRWDKLQMQEAPEPARRCCLESQNFTAIPSLDRDPDTGYLEGTYYQCICGSRIAESDFSAVVEYENNKVLVIEVTPEQPAKGSEAA
jgi:hypothetical protein